MASARRHASLAELNSHSVGTMVSEPERCHTRGMQATETPHIAV